MFGLIFVDYSPTRRTKILFLFIYFIAPAMFRTICSILKGFQKFRQQLRVLNIWPANIISMVKYKLI